MDNICHTLVGAAIGEAGLKTRTRFGNPALMIAANLPDVDVLVFLTGTPSVAFRRGWTHGILAQAMLPLLLTGVLLLWARWRPAQRGSPAVRPGALLALGYIGVLSHVLLDYLNNYGVRLLLPFSGRWFYGDTLFIVDLWLWLMLGTGIVMARRRRQVRPARVALACATLYAVAMAISASAARQIVLTTWVRTHGTPPRALMVGPLPVTPFSKAVIVDAGDHFETGRFSWWGARVWLDPGRLPNRSEDMRVLQAEADPYLRALLTWSRFPYFEISTEAHASVVTMTDLRFGGLVGRTSVRLAR